MNALTKWLERYRAIILLTLLYGLACKIANMLLYTIVSSFVLLKGKTGIDFSNTVNEVAGQYVFLAYAVSACLVAATVWLGDRALYAHRHFWNEEHRKFWQLERVAKEELFRGVGSGFSIAAVYLLAFVIAGEVTYLGIYITSAVGTPVFPLFFMDLVSLVVFVLSEEFLFRHKLLKNLLEVLPPRSAVLFSSALYLGIKYFQFQLVPLDYINLFFLNLTLGFFYLKSERAHRGIGFLAALYGSLHSLAGLPLWSHSSPSFFLFKELTNNSPLLTGGDSGPLSSLGLTSVLFVFTVGSYVSWKRSEEKNSED